EDQIGFQSGSTSKITINILKNGNYVVRSSQWDNQTATDAGAVTFGSGTTGVSGAVSAANSLIGTSSFDDVGNFITELVTGNYVVDSPDWSSSSASQVGAVTFGSGTIGVKGTISAANSLIGSTSQDDVGLSGDAGIDESLLALPNGNYVVLS